MHEVNELSENHMVRRCLALPFFSALPSYPMTYLVLSILMSASPVPSIKSSPG